MKKIYSAIITPLTENGDIDIKSLERMIERNLKHGLDGFFFLGSMGEWSQFTDENRDKLIKEACRIIGDKADILAALSSTSLIGTLENMKKLSKYAVKSFVITIPPKPLSFIDPIDFISEVAGKSDRSVYFYYLPGVIGRSFSYDEFEKILSHPKIIGIKNSSGQMRTRKELLMLRRKHDFKLFEGDEWAVDEALMMGCDGALVGLGTLASKPLKAIAAAVDAGDYPKAMEIQEDLVRVFWGIYGKELQNVWIGQKYALEKLGIFSTHKTLIQNEKTLTPQRKTEIEKCLSEYKDFLD